MFESYCKKLYMDYEGQRAAEYWFTRIVTLSGLIGLAIGYHYQQFSLTVYSLGVGFVLAALVTIPPWPMYRRKPLNWRKHNPNMWSDQAATSSNSSRDTTPPPPKTRGRGKGKKN